MVPHTYERLQGGTARAISLGMSNTELVLVETMPDHLRDSHRAAGNWGVYPHNGAERVLMSREDAEAATADDEYDHVVRAAKPSDLERYETV